MTAVVRARIWFLPRIVGWVALAGSLAGYLAISAMGHQPFHIGIRELRFFDLRVYRGAAHRMLDDASLYRRPILRKLGFTYPPAAALLLAPLALVPLAVDKIAVTYLNVAALVWMLHSTLAMVERRRNHPPGLSWSTAAWLASFALWAEPVTTTLGYGQIDLLVVALVMFDFSRPDDAPYKGISLGIAAGIKLTPLLFIVYLLLAGRKRIAAVATGSFAATIFVSWAVAGKDTTRYWGGLVLDSSRVGGAGDDANQSLRGALARLTDNPHPGGGLELIVVFVALLGLVLAVRAARNGNDVLGFGLAALTTLLASPVSWTHHWTLAIPALVLLAVSAHRRRSLPMAAAAIAAAITAYAYVPERYMNMRGDAMVHGLASIPADPYVLVGLLALVAAAFSRDAGFRGAVGFRRRLDRSPVPDRPAPE